MSLEEAIRRFLTPVIFPWPREAGTELSSWVALRALDSRRLLDLDLASRRFYRSAPGEVPARVFERLSWPELDEKVRETALFVVAMHFSAQMRSDVLRSIGLYPSRLALAACLIRSADWVEAVRKRALELAVELIFRCKDDDVVALLPLFFRLYEHERFDNERVDEALRAWATPSPDRVERLMQSGHSAIRRWGFELAVSLRAPGEISLLARALHDPDPRIAMSALRYLGDMSESERRHWFLEGLGVSHPAVRQAALRNYPPAVPVDVLTTCLVDPAAGVRSLAAFLFREQHNGRALDVWRHHADTALPPRGAVQALADLAESVDLPRMRRLLHHPNSKARAAALRGLSKAGGLPSDDEFLAAIADTSWEVRRALHTVIRTGGVVFDADRLRRAWTLFPDQAADATTHALDALSEHDRFDLLVAFEPATDVERDWRNRMLETWARPALGWWPLKDYERVGLVALLQRQPDGLMDQLKSRFEKAVLR